MKLAKCAIFGERLNFWPFQNDHLFGKDPVMSSGKKEASKKKIICFYFRKKKKLITLGKKEKVRKNSKARTCVSDATLIIRSQVEKKEMVFNCKIDAKVKALVNFLKEESSQRDHKETRRFKRDCLPLFRA